MPWDIAINHPGCERGEWAVIKQGGGLVACHPDQASAKRHLAALYANEGEGMSADTTILGHSVALANAEMPNEDGLQWIEMLPTAEKARNGEWYFTVEESDLGTYAQHIRENADRIPVDYDHGGGSRRLMGGSTRAAGWLTGEAEVRRTEDDEPRLYARVKWTPRARQEITDGEFRFISPEFSFKKREAKTGLLTQAKEFAAATLTNRPFFRQLAPVLAEQLGDDVLAEVEVQHGELVAELIRAVRDGEAAPTEAAVAAVEAVIGAVWSTAFINDLPDSSFLHIESGGEKDSEGKTTPRSLRHFPYKDAEGKVDLPHLRNAIARAPQASLPDGVKTRVQERARRILERMNEAALEAAEAEAEGPPADPPADPPAADPAPADEPQDEPAPQPESTPDDPSPADTEGEADMADVSTAVLAALGVPEHADEATILAALEAKDNEIKERDERIVELEKASENNEALSTRVAELEAQGRKREVTVMLSDEVRLGRVAPNEVEPLTKAYADNIEGLKELVNARPMGFFAKLEEVGAGGSGGGEDPNLRALAEEIGATDPVDRDSAELHLETMKVLESQGKAHNHTAEEYLAAMHVASKASA